MNIQYQQSRICKFSINNFSAYVFVLLSTLGVMTYSGPIYAVDDFSLKALEDTNFDSFMLADQMSILAPKKVYIEAVEASFSKDWIRKFRPKTSRKYRNKTLQEYAETLHSNLSKKLSSAGWIVFTEPTEGAITISAKLMNLYINGPDTVNKAHPLLLNIGRSGIELSVFDTNNQLVIHIKDMREAGSPSESFIETNKALNLVRFNKMFYGWANDLTIYLNIISDL